MIRHDRNALLTAVKKALESNPQVDAAWEGGSAAYGALDEFSDIDAVAVVADDAVAAAFAGVEESLVHLAPIAQRCDIADSHGYTQKFYRLEGFPDYQVVDLVFIRRSDPLLFRELELHGRGETWFDRTGVLTELHYDLKADLEKARHRVAALRDAFAMFQHIPTKERKRGRAVEALFFYHSMTVRPLIEAFRLLYCPHLRIYSVRYIARDLPAPVVALLTELSFVSDLADLEAKQMRAEAAFWEAMRLLEREGPGALAHTP